MLILRSAIITSFCSGISLAAQLAFIDLPTEDATINGKGILKEGFYMSKIRDWNSADASLSWIIHFPVAGKIDIWINQSCVPSAAGGTYILKIGDKSISAKVVGTNGWHTFKKVHIGEFEIKKPGKHTLSIQATHIPQNTLMHFDKVTLKGAAVTNATREAYQLTPIIRQGGIKLPKDRKIKHNTLSAFEREAGWQLLFDGQTTDGWTGYRSATVPEHWSVKNGELVCNPKEDKAGASLITQKKFSHFEFSCEWLLTEGGDSGLFFRFDESKYHPYEQFPEYQIFDNHSMPNALKDQRASGACYDLYPSTTTAYRGPHKWNHSRVRIVNNKVEFYLNNIKTADFSLDSPTYKYSVSHSKFHRWADFGKLKEGHIGLQDYYSEIRFRNIKLRSLATTHEK